MKKYLFAFWLTLLVSQSAFSQIWQAYKGVWLKGYDNATQAPIPPTGYSALTYFADSLGTYVYDWDSLAWLRIPGAGSGGGGGGLVTADNALSVNPAGNVQLGGPLLASTNITGTGTQNLNFGTTTNPLNLFAVNTDNNISLGRQETTTLFNRLLIGQASSSFNVQFNASRKSTYTFGGVNAFFDVADNSEKVRLDLRTSSNNEILLTSDSSSVISRFRVLPDKIRLESDNVYLSKSPVELDTAVWFLARDFNTGAIVQRKASGGGGGITTADNGLNVDPAGNVRIGTATLPGKVLDDGAVFSTDSLNMALSHFWFMPDSVQIGNLADLGEGYDPAYVLMKNGLLSGYGENGVDLASNNTKFRLNTNATATLESGSVLTMNVSNPALVNLSATGSNATLIMQAENGFQIFDPEILVSGGGINEQLQIGRLNSTRDDGIVRIYYTGRTGGLELGLLAGGPFIQATGDNRTFRVEAVGANSNIVVKAGSGGFVIMEDLPTTDPCGSAPSGTVWDNSGVLSRCP